MTLRREYPRVALCVDKARSYGRRVLQGIARYVEAYGPWSLYLDPDATGAYAAEWLRDWQGDGVLAFIENPSLAAELRRRRIPTVELFGHRDDLDLPQVGLDEEAFGRTGAEHLIERRFQRFGFCGYVNVPWSERRLAGFAAGVKAANGSLETFRTVHLASGPAEWEVAQQRLTRWLCGLQYPTGVLACSDRLAQRMLEACRRASIAVPDQIAVIGVDNDEETCRLAQPALTSIADDAPRMGFEAARLLDQCMSEGMSAPARRTLRWGPAGVVIRQSTDVLAVEDRLVAQAMRIIREQACSNLTVPVLLSQLSVSRSVLYRRFDSALQRSPHREILRMKLQHARWLMRQTDLTLDIIAERCGFRHSEYLSVAFKRETGVTPGRFRENREA